MPLEEGDWEFRTTSTARSLDGIAGAFRCAGVSGHGPVRVADTFHFRYADGTRYVPVGTTAYAWTSQPAALEERTLRTLAESPFNKVRMCVFPKSYVYNHNDPEYFAFEGSAPDTGGGFDTTRFNVEFFRHLERRIDQLADLGIEADLILYHPYDRWGFANLGRSADSRLLSYLVRRLAARANIWWSMANEYDLMPAKSIEDWEHLAAVVQQNDPYRHLLSIHNCLAFYDYHRPWITHSSIQRIDVYRTAENTNQWRTTWGKPVVIDEIGYEGDLDQGWGNLTAPELVRRCWEGAVRGGYVAHGETYLNDAEELWWSKGGELVGESPVRMAFLAELIADSPTGTLDPIPTGPLGWDLPIGGVLGEYQLAYFGFNRPRFRTMTVPADQEVTVDVIDTWNMTVERRPGTYRGQFRVELPARQFMAVRLIRVHQPPVPSTAVVGPVTDATSTSAARQRLSD